MIQISSVLYLLGTVGGTAGLYATLAQTVAIGPMLVFVSILLLWAGLFRESIEETAE